MLANFFRGHRCLSNHIYPALALGIVCDSRGTSYQRDGGRVEDREEKRASPLHVGCPPDAYEGAYRRGSLDNKLVESQSLERFELSRVGILCDRINNGRRQAENPVLAGMW